MNGLLESPVLYFEQGGEAPHWTVGFVCSLLKTLQLFDADLPLRDEMFYAFIQGWALGELALLGIV